MARRDPETNPAGFLGDELRRARVTAGFSSQDALASRLGFDRTVITKAESGDRPPTAEVLAAWCQACSLPGIPPDWVAGMAKRSGAATPAWFERWLQAEREALILRYWQPIIVPALFQTAEYARALLLAAQADTSDETIGALVSERLERRVIFDRLDPPNVVAVLDELVLRRLIGSAQVMHDQLTELAELSTRPYISMEVVPASVGANAGLGGAVNIASGNGEPDLVYMDAIKGQTTDSRELVHQAAVTFDRVRGDALPRGQSRDLILRLADELWKA
jgi:transcriptional regulator with XRE-family HTH domain